MTSKVLLRGGCVLTLGSKTPNLPQADVLIEDGVVAEIGSGIRARDAELVDATETIVMPGFIDAHRHAWKSLFRNAGGTATGGSITSAEDGSHYQPDDVYTATLVSLWGAVEAGITTVVDWADVPAGRDGQEAAFQAHVDSGLRTTFVLVEGLAREEKDGKASGEILDYFTAGAGPSTRIGLGHQLEASSSELDWSLARERGMSIHLHGGPGAAGEIARLGSRQLLSSDVTVSHCSALDPQDLDALASSKASVSLAPASEMARGFGSPPVQGLIDRGIRIGLGVDDEQLSSGDMFAQIRATISLQHTTFFGRKLQGEGNLPRLMNTREVIRYATVNGARAAGWDGVTGSLEPGMKADIIVLRTDRPNIFPVNDPLGAVVWGMDTSNLEWVFVDGNALMREGQLQTDLPRLRASAAGAAERVGGSSAPFAGALRDGQG